ncbi:hypothetical protein REH77_21565, partial [Vibrio alginolyticus]
WADINGDGFIDFVSEEENAGADPTLFTHTSSPYALDKISYIQEQAVDYAISYKPAADQSVHKQKRYFEFPFVNTTPPRYLVSQVKKRPKGYEQTTYSYLYEGAKSHYLGGGFLGFATITEVANADVTTTKVSSYYQLDLKTAGELKSVNIYKQNEGADAFSYSDVDKVSSTSYQYKTNTTGKIYQVYADSIVQSQYEKGALLKTSTTSRTINKF